MTRHVMPSFVLAAALALPLALASVPSHAAHEGPYRNFVANYALDVPHLFGRPPETSDFGLRDTFTDASGEVELTVFQWSAAGAALATVAREVKQETADTRDFTYERVATRWMVQSGYFASDEADRTIFYERTEVLPGDRLVTMRVTWPESRRADVDGLMKRMGRSLRPAR